MNRIGIVLLPLMVYVLVFVGVAGANTEPDAKAEQKKAILVVSFGTSVPKAEKGITNLVDAAKKAFPDYEVRLAYTSNIIRNKIAKERNIKIPTPPEALSKLNEEGYGDVVVATTLLIPGEEYESVKSVVDAFRMIDGKYRFARLRLLDPFLTTLAGCEQMADLLAKRFGKELSRKDTAVVLMGHGTPQHFSHALYAQLQLLLDERVPSSFFVGTVEETPLIEDVIKMLKKSGKKRVTLSPLMVVAGDHAINDMSDPDDNESWFSRLKKAGYKDVSVKLEGLGEDPLVAELFVQNLRTLVR